MSFFVFPSSTLLSISINYIILLLYFTYKLFLADFQDYIALAVVSGCKFHFFFASIYVSENSVRLFLQI